MCCFINVIWSSTFDYAKIHKMIRNMMCQNSGSMWFANSI